MREASSTHKRKARMGCHRFATPKVLRDLGIDGQLLTAPKMETTSHYEPSDLKKKKKATALRVSFQREGAQAPGMTRRRHSGQKRAELCHVDAVKKIQTAGNSAGQTAPGSADKL